MTIKSLLVFFICILATYTLAAAHVTIDFYGQKITLHYNETMFEKGKKIKVDYINSLTGKLQIQEYYETQLAKDSHHLFLKELERVKRTYRLNDYLLYRLSTKIIDAIAVDFNRKEQALLNWFLLNAADYDCRITYIHNNIYLNVYTRDDLFELPIIEQEGKNFANISENEKLAFNNLYIVDYAPNPNGKAFQFTLDNLPLFPSSSKQKNVKFKVEGEEYAVAVTYDAMPIEVMRNYPYLSDEKYFSVPLSGALKGSIIPHFKKILKQKTEREGIAFLAAFTRSAFDYKLDEEYFGKSRPMIPEELFHFPYSDCEDRCALFYALAKELLDLPIIVLSFDNHLSIAVAPKEEMAGEAILYAGKKYYVCDPTGPHNSSEIGFFPKEYRDKSFDIIARYK